MVQSIPIDQIVTINPGVIGTGSNPLALNGLFIGESDLIPTGKLLTFYSADDVSAWFGSASVEAQLANVYFNGFTNATKYPNQIFFIALPTEARGAWARGLSLKGMLLSELKDISGSLAVTINGEEYSIDAFNLSASTSFSNAASIISAALGIEDVATISWDAMTSRFVVTVTDDLENSEISQFTGTMAEALGLASSTISLGSGAMSITDVLNSAKTLNLNWVTYTHIEQWEQDQLLEASIWSNNQNNKYLFVASDNDPKAIVSGDESNFGFIAGLRDYNGVVALYDNNDTPLLKAFVMGYAASIDWKRYNGRTAAAFRTQSGLLPTCDNLQTAEVLLANGYNYFGQYAGRGEDNNYSIFYNGQMPGIFKWLDTYLDQVYLNSQLQLAMIDLLMAVNSIPYNSEGYALVRNAALDPINEAINNGSIRAGVTLSSSQKAQIISKVGFDITRELYTDGYYFQVEDADAQTRGNRQSPPINFFYTDGGSIQQITIPSIAIL